MNRKEHLLLILAEECAELQQAVSKAMRFGLDDRYNKVESNREEIVREYLHVLAAVTMLIEAGHLPRNTHEFHRKVMDEKIANVERFLEYAEQKGTLNE